MDEIKRLYDEAARLHRQAMDILAEYKGKDMPKEKAQEVDRLLDEVEAKTQEAKRLERAAEQDKFLNEPATRKAFFQDKEGQKPPLKVVWNGKEVDPEDLAELKNLQPFPAFIDLGDGAYKSYARAMRAYLRKGAADITSDERKALAAGDAPAGGYLVQDTFVNQLLVKARDVSAMRRICTVLPPVPSGSVIVPTEESLFTDATWTTEVLTGSADVVKPFGQLRLTPYPLAKRVLVTNTFLRTPTFDVEAYVRDRLAYKFGIPEEAAFVNGDGIGKPLGILQTPGLPTYTTATSNTVTADDIINWVYSLKAAYAARARILCNRAFVRKCRLLKDGMGQYIWQAGLAAGVPNTILDTPYEFSDQFDDGLDASDAWEDNAKIAVIGDFSYYWIVDALGMSIQRLVEHYAEANQTGYIGRKESGGTAVLAEAFNALVVKP